MSVLAYGQTGLQAPSPTSSSNPHSAWLVNLLRSNRLTLLVGTPGAARDAMLHSGLTPLLVQRGAGAPRAERVVRFDRWGLQPLAALRAQLEAELPVPGATPATLADQLRAAAERYRTTIMLVLDAFEQHLAQPAQRPDVVRFDRELAECLAREALPVHMLAVLDDATDPALQRYAQWVPKFGRDWLRLPDPSPATAATPLEAPPARPALDTPASGPAREEPWVDTDILPLLVPDDEHTLGDDGHWLPDLVLGDEPTRAFAAPPPAAPAGPEPSAAPAVPTAHEPPEPALAPVAAPEAAAHEDLTAEPMHPAHGTHEWTPGLEPEFDAAPIEPASHARPESGPPGWTRRVRRSSARRRRCSTCATARGAGAAGRCCCRT